MDLTSSMMVACQQSILVRKSGRLKMLSGLVLLSGGMDSSTLLYYVIETLKYDKVEAIVFDYGQRHRIEISYAQTIAERLGISYEIVKVDIAQFGGSSLISEDRNLSVVVPGRNAIFLSLAAAYAKTRELEDVFFGPTLEDYSGFPDCRDSFVRLMNRALAIGIGIRGIHAPFIHLGKKEVVALGKELGVPYDLTWSCYFPTDNNKPCGRCHACMERELVL